MSAPERLACEFIPVTTLVPEKWEDWFWGETMTLAGQVRGCSEEEKDRFVITSGRQCFIVKFADAGKLATEQVLDDSGEWRDVQTRTIR